MRIEVAGNESPFLSVLGSTLCFLEGDARPLGDVVTSLQSWPPFSALALDHILQQISLQGIMSHDMSKNDSFLFFTVLNIDLLVPGIRITS